VRLGDQREVANLQLPQQLSSAENWWPGPEVRSIVAAPMAGAKEGVAWLGAHLKMRDDAAPGPLTKASAPQAPGQLGR
jgi:hypothetical protein